MFDVKTVNTLLGHQTKFLVMQSPKIENEKKMIEMIERTRYSSGNGIIMYEIIYSNSYSVYAINIISRFMSKYEKSS